MLVYRKYSDFYMWIVYPAALLNSLIRFNCSFCWVWRIFCILNLVISNRQKIKKKERKKRYQNWEGRNTTIFVHKRHDYLYRRHERIGKSIYQAGNPCKYKKKGIKLLGQPPNDQVKWKSLSPVQLFAIPRTIPSMEFPGQNTGMGSRSLLQGIFPNQGSNTGLLHCRWILYQLSHKGSPVIW